MPRSFSTPLRAFRLASRTSTGTVRNEVAVGIDRLSFIAFASIADGPRSAFASPSAAVAGLLAPAPLAAASTSAFVTRPPWPVPWTEPRSMPRSAAIRLAIGDARPSPSATAGSPAAAATGAACGWPSAGAAPEVGPAVISASGWPTATTSSGCTRSFVIVPAAGAGTSASTLSVETSMTVSPSSTESPSCLCHSRMVPSVTDSPISGMVICTASPPPPSVSLPGSSPGVGDSEGASSSPMSASPSPPPPSSSPGPASSPGPGSVSAVAAPEPSPAEAPLPDPLGSSCARTCPTETVSSGWAMIFSRTPLAGAGTSASTLSVETSTTVSPSSTKSPSVLCHSRTTPSVTDSPIWGIWISTMPSGIPLPLSV